MHLEKTAPQAMVSRKQPRPWTTRQLDLLYYVFFLIHIPATVLCDLQALYPAWMTAAPSPLHKLLSVYLEMTHDPVVSGSLGLNGDASHWLWIKTFFLVEAFFQLPSFIAGVYGLRKDTPKIYPLLLVYSTTAVIQTLPCLVDIYSMPLVEDNTILSPLAKQSLSGGRPPVITSLTQAQFISLLMCYVPFMMVPTIMMVDMGLRVSKLVSKAVDAEDTKKFK